MSRIAFVTDRSQPSLSADDELAASLLRRAGHRVEAASWEDDAVRWSGYDAVVVRSCWDYWRRPAEFAGWLAAREADGDALWNPAPLLRWNADKRYLRELGAAGVPVTPTEWVGGGTGASLEEILRRNGWDRAVVKPCVSASAGNTWATTLAAARGREAEFARLAARVDVMVQPFVEEVTTRGEWSLVFIEGCFSHAVLKRPRSGDFRVQRQHGGSAEAARPSPLLVVQAARALAAAPRSTLYARVDGCEVAGVFQLMELELLEPCLFLEHDPGAPLRLAEAVARAAGHARG
jgi:hypothetical protein